MKTKNIKYEILALYKRITQKYMEGKMKNFNYIFDAIQDIFVGIAVTLTVTLSLNRYAGIMPFMSDVALAFIINYITGIVINTRSINGMFCRKLKITEKTKRFILMQVIINTIIYVTVIALVMFLIKIGFTIAVIEILKKVYLKLIVVAFIVGYIMAPVSAKITEKLLCFSRGKINDEK